MPLEVSKDALQGGIEKRSSELARRPPGSVAARRIRPCPALQNAVDRDSGQSSHVSSECLRFMRLSRALASATA
jgi:hypothetical protein